MFMCILSAQSLVEISDDFRSNFQTLGAKPTLVAKLPEAKTLNICKKRNRANNYHHS